MKPKPSSLLFSIDSNSHEFQTFSWWAAHASHATDLEMVGEESEHRPIWGLRRDSEAVSVPWAGSTVRVGVSSQGTVVGTNRMPLELARLSVQCPTGVVMDDVLHHARTKFTENFRRLGLKVFYTRKYSEDVHWESFGMLPARSIGSVSLEGRLETDLLADAERFLREQAVYDKAGRPYKRVYCLHGPPGTGKTSTVVAIASELGKDLAIFNVDSLRDDTFIELMSLLPSGAVVMFEDVDAMFKQRESVTGGMTFSTLLNSLDGILHPRGTLIFLTTNHLDRLDSAMHRPGRVDRLVKIGNSSAEQRSAMWKNVFPDVQVPPVLLSHNPNISPAWLSAILFQHRDAPQAQVVAAISAGLKTRLKSKKDAQS